jgi:hypothetical protein
VDTDQIEQRLNTTRSAIDYKLDLLGARVRGTRRQAVPVALGVVAALLGGLMWRTYRRRRAMKRLALAA